MKKFFKIAGYTFLAIFALAVVVAMFSEEDKPSTGTSSASSAENSSNKAQKGSKVIDASGYATEVLGLKVALGEIIVAKDKIQVGLNLENLSSDELTFYPDQGSAVVGNLQLDANMFFTDGEVSGEIHSGVLKEGVIEFLAPEGKTIDVDSLTQIKLAFGDVFNDTSFDAEDVNFSISVQ